MPRKPTTHGIEEAAETPAFVREVLHFLDNHRPSKPQISLVNSLLYTKSLKVHLLIDQRLSRRQQDCLLLTMHGQTAKQIAAMLKMSIRTVELHLESARRKLGCATTTQAILEGIRHDVVHPSEELQQHLKNIVKTE